MESLGLCNVVVVLQGHSEVVITESKRFYQDDSQTESELWGWRMKASVGFGRWEKFRQARGVTAAAGGFPEAVSVL